MICMKVRGIAGKLLDLLCELGADSDPQEFVALLKTVDGVIAELELLPGTITSEDSALLPLYMAPLTTDTAGSAHSHPRGVLAPSRADLQFFPRSGRYHIILGPPYDRSAWRCFLADGSPCALAVIE
jgi:proteasome lid subunit RPN8/RPN11